MREFGIRFRKGLRKGLRPFPTSAPGQEMLIECFNLQPGENGLLPRDELYMVDADLAYTYFCFLSEVGDVWCVYIDTAGQIVTNYGPPGNIEGFIANDTSLPVLPRFTAMPATNEPSLTLYMYPDIAGSLTVDYAPPGGEGYAVDNLPFMSTNGYMYNLVVTNVLETVARQVL